MNPFDPPEKQLEELFTRHRECHKVLDSKNYSPDWFKNDDLVASMKNAIIIRIVQHIALTHSPEEAVIYRELLNHVLADKPYKTRNIDIQGLIVASSQMVSNSWEARQKLIEAFLIKE